ncbi:efflux RND transporter periplasmic adaptor subunit [Sphingomonas sp. CGMCC 1.13654]|uniref:Efflux RND transporter periplasmic adaptor subunit n=1 Tax=Sphingomonas chungangi TaxID=2683589 RepID=A0A838L9K0_9SPHN|nr:efflux RND transporter periplasmic adaptor subunit [Sphingomonas chungangi]MBA2935580.1 efflux RND transporter periplasmic adaptor subunit [Sphingomonas chungangi]MVW54271.1 efflux RND transporter periplasmic adaptor subunit [Sphingomonas chungangi]
MHDVTTQDGEAPSVDNGTLKKIGIIAVIVALLVVAWGLFSRHRSDSQLKDWTQDQATPNVSVIAPKPMDSGNSLVLPGNVQAYNSAPLYARTNGYVSKWFVDIGSPVKTGQVMAVIDIPDVDQQLAAARADLQTAKANEALASTTATRWTTLLKQDAVSKQESDEKTGDFAAKRAVTNAAAANVSRLVALQGFSRIVAPFAGVVTSRSTQIGQLVSAGAGTAQPLFTVSDVSKMRIYVRVPQAYSAELKPGLHAQLSLPEYPGRTFDAVMTRTADAVDQQSGTVLVELQAANGDGALKPGAYAQVKFPITGTSGSVVVPASAILYRSDGTLVATVGPGNKAMLHQIKIGRDMGDTLEVTSGLTQRDRLIDSPPDSMENGDPVKIAQPKQGAADAKQ